MLKYFAIIIALVTIGYFLVPATYQNQVKELLFESGSPAQIQEVTPHDIILIADGTGSNNSTYAIPQLDTTFVSSLIDSVFTHGSGRLWLTYIDSDSRNNKVEYLRIIQHPEPQKEPVRSEYNTLVNFSRAHKSWVKHRENQTSDSLKVVLQFQREKQVYLEKVAVMLSKVYKKGSPDNQWTDVNGSLNAAFKILGSVSDEAVKTIVLFSDSENDQPKGKKIPELNIIPADIHLFALNPVGGSSNKATPEIIEVESQERLLQTVFQEE